MEVGVHGIRGLHVLHHAAMLPVRENEVDRVDVLAQVMGERNVRDQTVMLIHVHQIMCVLYTVVGVCGRNGAPAHLKDVL